MKSHFPSCGNIFGITRQGKSWLSFTGYNVHVNHLFFHFYMRIIACASLSSFLMDILFSDLLTSALLFNSRFPNIHYIHTISFKFIDLFSTALLSQLLFFFPLKHPSHPLCFSPIPIRYTSPAVTEVMVRMSFGKKGA